MARGISTAARNASPASAQQPARGGVRAWLLGGPRDVVTPRLVLIVSVLVLTAIGLVMVFSSSTIEALSAGQSVTSYLTKQAALAGAGIAAAIFIAVVLPYYRWFGRLLDAYWVACVVLLVLTWTIGLVGLGAKRWLSLGPITFQPSELLKPCLVLVAARIMYRYRTEGLSFEDAAKRAAWSLGVPLLIVLGAQSDLGTTLICLVGIMAVLWLADVPWKPFVAAVVVIVALGSLAIFTVGYRADRMAFIDPYADPYDTGYQLIRSFYAFGQGGLFGVGLGGSREKYLYLPEAETDFIFAIIGEEMGLVGAVVVLLLFLAVLYAGLKIARNAPDSFGCMIAGGCVIMLVFQAFLNIGCVLGVLPTTGKPLPFISNGGTSLLGSYLLVGIILSVSFASGNDSGVYDRRRADLRVIRAGRS